MIKTVAESTVILLVFPLLASVSFLWMMTMLENCVVSEINVLWPPISPFPPAFGRNYATSLPGIHGPHKDSRVAPLGEAYSPISN